MRSKLKTIIAIVAISSFGIWLFANREKTTWYDETPDRLVGEWRLIKDFDSDNYGIRTITLRTDSIKLHTVDDYDDKTTESYPVKSCSLTKRDGAEGGEAVVFYGADDEKTKTKHRLHIRFGIKQKITVHHIVATGYGEDHRFDVGEFVKVN